MRLPALRDADRIGRTVPWVLTSLLGFAYGPGLLRSPLLQGDLPGHLEAIRWSAEHLWPLPWGWDPRYLCGLPVGILYPPLLGWVGGGLARATGAENALRIVLLASILALPGALYRAGRGLGLRPRGAGWASALGLAVLWLPWRGLGGSLRQSLVAGNAANALALPLLLLLISRLRAGLSRRSHWAGPAVLLSLTLLCHFLIGAVAGLAVMATTFWRAWRLGSPRALRRGAWIVALGSLGASPFLLPFAVHFAEASPDSIGASPFPSALEWLALGGVALAVLLHPRWTAHPMIPFVGLLAVLYALRGAVFPLIGTPPVRMEYHRFRLFLYLAGVPALFLLLQARAGLRPLLRPVAAGVGILVTMLVAGLRYDAMGPRSLPLPARFPDLGGRRVLVLAGPGEQNGSWNGLQLLLPPRLGAAGIKGLFVEASPIARPMFELERLAAGPGSSPHWWAIRTLDPAQLAALSGAEIAARFAELGVEAIVARGPVSRPVHRLARDVEDLGGGFALYRLPEAPLAVALEPRDGPRKIPATMSPDGGRIELALDRPGRVRLAVARFSDWRVVEGHATLDTMAPGVLAVEGAGRIVLSVGPRAEEWIGLALGGVACAILLARMVRRATSRRALG